MPYCFFIALLDDEFEFYSRIPPNVEFHTGPCPQECCIVNLIFLYEKILVLFCARSIDFLCSQMCELTWSVAVSNDPFHVLKSEIPFVVAVLHLIDYLHDVAEPDRRQLDEGVSY